MAAKPYVLVVRQLGGIGDCLMLSCVFRGLREKFPKHTIKLATSATYLSGSLIDIAEHNPYIDEIHTIEPYELACQDMKKCWGQFHGSPAFEDDLFWKRADFAVDLNTACIRYETAAMNTPAGVQKPRWQIWCEEAQVAPSSYAPIYRISNNERRSARAYAKEHWGDKTVVGLGLGSVDRSRAGSIDQLLALAEGLKAHDIHPVTIDAIHHYDGTDAIFGKRIREIVPLISCMHAVIAVDSGVLHMAGTVGVPVIGLFGPTDFAMRMGNYQGSAIDSRKLVDCAPCWYNRPCANAANGHQPLECMNSLDTSIIIEETLRWVNGPLRVRH